MIQKELQKSDSCHKDIKIKFIDPDTYEENTVRGVCAYLSKCEKRLIQIYRQIETYSGNNFILDDLVSRQRKVLIVKIDHKQSLNSKL
jgi:hypothetical protein